MRKACVIGWPVTHSLSPVLHHYWLRHYGIEGAYTAEEVQAARLPVFLKSMEKEGFSGCNVTLPHKEAVIPYLDSVDATAKAIGAVNTIIVKDGQLHGTNTDAFGFMENIRQSVSLEGKKQKAVVLGAGGAARAVVYALVQEGFAAITLINRTEQKAKALQEQFGNRIDVKAWEQREDALADADLLVNTTSLGLKGKEQLPIQLEQLPKSAIVNDIIYNPLHTPLLQVAARRGNVTVNGLGMLLYQAVPAFEAWFLKRPQVDGALRQYMVEKLS
jgi:shikimate dehydrogenase